MRYTVIRFDQVASASLFLSPEKRLVLWDRHHRVLGVRVHVRCISRWGTELSRRKIPVYLHS